MKNFSYAKPDTAATALDLLNDNGQNTLVAGGTNLLDLMKYQIAEPGKLIDINALQEYRTIEELDNGGLRLGALMTNADTAYHPLIEQRYPLLNNAILAGASAQIRNMATNGGNLMQRTRCYYFYDIHTPCNKRKPGAGCAAMDGYSRNMAILGTSEHCIAVFPSDMCVALAALDASINLASPNSLRVIPFSDFHRLPSNTPHIDNTLKAGEMITGIDLPKDGFAANYSYLKLRDRSSYAFALVAVATGLEMEGDFIKTARIALGGVAPKPWRKLDAEEFLAHKRATAGNFEKAAEILLAGAKSFQHNGFKIELAKRAIVRNCLSALNPKI
jgi:xanthine dehydrogenase YagS FAD-binding subunit